MTDDLLARLRVFHEYDADKSSFMREAADRIEQLTAELDKAVKLGKAGGYKATPEHSWAEWCDELYRDLNKANERIEQLDAQVARLRAAMNDMVPYLSRADYYYMEPQTLDVLREINGGGNGR